MPSPSAIAVFDIGKTNRKVVVFDEAYRVVDLHFFPLKEAVDAEGHPSLPLDSLRRQVLSITETLLADPRWDLKAVNFTAYGATMVWLDGEGRPVHPVVDYLKPYPEACRVAFEREHGPVSEVVMRTASPWLGNLNAGLQLYALKKTDAARFRDIRHAVYLPQYVSSMLTGRLFSEATGIGCHTLTWDFEGARYHDWVRKEGIDNLFPDMRRADDPVHTEFKGVKLLVGIGMHDSSSALIPYLRSIDGPFLLLSTGTWSICLNPFEGGVLTREELETDCLNYMRLDGGPVKASRLPLGFRHDAMVEVLCRMHGVSAAYLRDMPWQEDVHHNVSMRYREESLVATDFDPSLWSGPVEAYHALMHHLMPGLQTQVRRVLSHGIGRIYVDGGFSGNRVFLSMLARVFPDLEVFAAEVGQSTALGAAVAMHSHWNASAVPDDLVRFMPVER